MKATQFLLLSSSSKNSLIQVLWKHKKKMNWISMQISSSNRSLKILYLLFLGQVVSLIVALSSFTSSLIPDLGVYAPIGQASFNYFALALVYGSILINRRQKLRVSWYWYLLLALADVQTNYFFNKAFQYTSLTSLALLDCGSVPFVVIFTWFLLGTRYSLWQLFGAALCVLGLGLMLLSHDGIGGGAGSRPLLGDLLAIAGVFFFAMTAIGEEFLVKNKDRVEVVAMLGAYGLLVSLIQSSVLELKSLESVNWSADIIFAIAGYTVSQFMFYTLVPIILQLSGAMMLYLSVLTSDMWALLLGIFFYHQQVDWLYFVSFAIIAVGLIIYSTNEKNTVSVTAPNDENSRQYQMLIDKVQLLENESAVS